MRDIVFFLTLALLSLPSVTHAQEFNAGFVQGLWYSQENIVAQQQVRIYVAIRNNSGGDLSGTVEFIDNGTRIERKSVEALDGRIVESWTDWTPSYGSHTLQANLIRADLSGDGENTQTASVTSSLAEDVVFVDYDTDNDGIGNQEDTDDDGDGISDKEEEENGTNPLVPNKKIELPTKDEIDPVQEETTDSIGPEGLEQYLANSEAENLLAAITTHINDTKKNLDEYREKRIKELSTPTPMPKLEVNADGFGAIIRTTKEDENKVTLPSVEGDGFADKAITLTGKLFDVAFTVVLAAFSFTLGYPAVLQLGFLILILFIIIKSAAKFGRRER